MGRAALDRCGRPLSAFPRTERSGLTLDVDWIKTVSGSLRTASGLPGSSYRPSLFTIGLGLNIASDPIERASPSPALRSKPR